MNLVGGMGLFGLGLLRLPLIPSSWQCGIIVFSDQSVAAKS